MKTLGNIIWLVFGGVEVALEYLVGGVALMITIIGIPFGLQCIKMGLLALWPFGSKVVKKESYHGCLNAFMNVLWFFVGGVWIWLTHVFFGLLFYITIIGSAYLLVRCISGWPDLRLLPSAGKWCRGGIVFLNRNDRNSRNYSFGKKYS